MALSARQQSKVIKMLGLFWVFSQHRSKTVRKRRRNHGYKINAKSFFAPAWATQPPQIGCPYILKASLQRLCRAILTAEGHVKKARKFPTRTWNLAHDVDDAGLLWNAVYVPAQIEHFDARANEKCLIMYSNFAWSCSELWFSQL